MSRWKLGLLSVFPASAALWLGCCAPGDRGAAEEKTAPTVEVAQAAPPPAPVVQQRGSQKPAAPPADVVPRLMGRIPAGTVIPEKGVPRGWTHVIEVVKPRLGSGDFKAAPQMAAKFASMFHLTILANVANERR
ncbi:MAG TPA: hypothetical protein VFA26_10545, partial [Gemmataceae bacterium]|nr:hypothetical protein [Gemmataceae bacterium]